MRRLNLQFVIAIVLIVGLFSLCGVAVWKLAGLSASDPGAREAYLKLMDPASLVSLFMLSGVLFLLGMAILDLDKGRVLVGMGKAQFARGLITYLFAVVTIGTAVVLVLSALLGTDKEKFDRGKEVLGLLLGVFGTMVGFYFASELSQAEAKGTLMVSSVLATPQEVTPGETLKVTAFVRGGTPPYRFAVSLDDLPAEYSELARPDGWVIKDLQVPASTAIGIRTVTLGVQDMAGEKVSAQTFVTTTAATPK